MIHEKWITILPNGVIQLGSVEKLNEIVHNFHGHLILINFSSTSCSACKSFDPIYSMMQKEFFSEGVIFLKNNVSVLPEIARQFQIRRTPTTLFIYNQKVKKSRVGILLPGPFRLLLQDLILSVEKSKKRR
ncbi:MAG: thioredoxin family protein [Promethearchaeota archaeon]